MTTQTRTADLERILYGHGTISNWTYGAPNEIVIRGYLSFDIEPTFTAIGAELDAIVAALRDDDWAVADLAPEGSLSGRFSLKAPDRLILNDPFMYRVTLLDMRSE